MKDKVENEGSIPSLFVSSSGVKITRCTVPFSLPRRGPVTCNSGHGGRGGPGQTRRQPLVGVGVKSHAFYTRPSHSARRLVGYGGCVLYKDDDDSPPSPATSCGHRPTQPFGVASTSDLPTERSLLFLPSSSSFADKKGERHEPEVKCLRDVSGVSMRCCPSSTPK